MRPKPQNPHMGPSIKDVPSKSGLFDPLPPCPPYDVAVTIKVALLCPLWTDPPLTWDILSGCPLKRSVLFYCHLITWWILEVGTCVVNSDLPWYGI